MRENITDFSEALMVDASAISSFALAAHFYEKDIVDLGCCFTLRGYRWRRPAAECGFGDHR